MLHILLLIIKCMGIVLASVLAVVLLAAALVLFCPFRYRAGAKKTMEEWEVSGRAGWLFGLVSVTVQKGSKASGGIQIRICGIGMDAWKKLFTRKKRPKKQSIEKKQMKKQPQEKQQAGDASDPPHTAENLPESAKPTAKTQPVLPSHSENADSPEISEDLKNPGNPKEAGDSRPQKENIFKRLWRRITDKCRSIWNTFKKIISTIRGLCGKINLWKDFLGESRTKAALGLTWQQLLGLLRHAGPQKWEGDLKLGLDDPAATGQALAVLGAAYPIHKGRIAVTPIWDQKILEGSVRVKGRVYGAALLCAAARLFFDKNVRSAFQWIMRQAG